MPKSSPNIKAVDLAKQKATSFGFNPNGRELVETVYLFQNDLSPATLNMNIVTGIFSISYDLNSRPGAISTPPPAPENAGNIVKSYLASANMLPDDLKTGTITNDFLKIEGGKFIKAASLSEANLTKVNLYRKNYNELPPVGPAPDQANVWFMLSGAKARGDQVIAAEYHYFPIDELKLGTYPIKTSNQAWDELKAKNAFFAGNTDIPDGKVVVRKVYLAYYDAGQYTEFYQPVVVFEGDNGFKAYVPAVTKDFYGE